MPNEVCINSIKISKDSFTQTINKILNFVENNEGGYICVTGTHGLTESFLNKSVKSAHRSAKLVVADGMPLVWINRILGHHTSERIYGPRLLNVVCSILNSAQHFFLGSDTRTLKALINNLLIRNPNLNIAGSLSPPFRSLNSAEISEITTSLKRLKPHIVWVGLSTPKQELLMQQLSKMLPNILFIGVGAAFDFLGGMKKQAPLWIQNSGFEWLFRLFCEPKRLWKRYVRIILVFPLAVLIDFLLSRRHER